MSFDHHAVETAQQTIVRNWGYRFALRGCVWITALPRLMVLPACLWSVLSAASSQERGPANSPYTFNDVHVHLTTTYSHAAMVEEILSDPQLDHVMFDISWDEIAKYLAASPDSIKVTADLINRRLDCILSWHGLHGSPGSGPVPEDLPSVRKPHSSR